MIDIRDYDLAMVERIKSYFENTFWINRPSIPIKEIRDRKILDGKDIEFPLITVRRTNCPVFSTEYNSWSRGKFGNSYNNSPDMSKLNNLANIDPDLSDKLKANGHHDGLNLVNSTFNLNYYIDVITFERDNFDTIMVELQENLFRNPYLKFNNVKSDGTIDKLIEDQLCHLLVEEVEDTSDLENFDSGNALYRATISVKINAYIYRKYKAKALEHAIIHTNINHQQVTEHDLCFTKELIND